MQVTVIGGTGHIGRFLVSQLVEDGHEVTVVSTGYTPRPDLPGWDRVSCLTATCKRDDAEWRRFLTDHEPEVLVDILQNDLPGNYEIVRSTCKHLIVCGSVWMLGIPDEVPVPEKSFTPPLGNTYPRRWHEIQETFKRTERDGLPFTVVLPPNICGPGKVPLDLKGGRDVDVHKSHARGEPVSLPKGINTLIGPCDASDVAQGFRLAVRHRDAAAGEVFNTGAPYALTFPAFVEAYADIYDAEIPTRWVDHDTFYTETIPNPGAAIHFRHHMCPDLTKSRRLLGYAPEFTCEETMARAVAWMHETGLL